jgi:hypothetical protein
VVQRFEAVAEAAAERALRQEAWVERVAMALFVSEPCASGDSITKNYKALQHGTTTSAWN